MQNWRIDQNICQQRQKHPQICVIFWTQAHKNSHFEIKFQHFLAGDIPNFSGGMDFLLPYLDEMKLKWNRHETRQLTADAMAMYLYHDVTLHF